MTKQEELEILKAAIDKLGNNSYCGPWLRSVYSTVEEALKSDLSPDVYVIPLEEARREADRIIGEGIEERLRTVTAGLAKAREMEEAAHREVERVRDQLANDIRRAMRAVSEW